jgi:tetratricopeptide (TPR) repeat protein
MSNLFGDFKRPRAEKKVIDQFIKKFENAKTLFKSKNYLEALTEYNKAYELLSDIWDVFPKIITLYIIMKGYFYTRQYDSCRNIMDILEPLLEYIPKSKFDLFIKLKSKIMIYQLILEFIYNHLDESFDAVIGMIKYLSQNDIFTL